MRKPDYYFVLSRDYEKEIKLEVRPCGYLECDMPELPADAFTLSSDEAVQLAKDILQAVYEVSTC